METYVGIDISKKEFEVKESNSKKGCKIPHTAEGITRLTVKFIKTTPRLVVIESTGGMERKLFRELHNAGVAVHVLNPRQARNFANAVGKIAKTDKIDAEMLALYAEKIEPRASTPRDPSFELLGELTGRRKQLVEMRSAEKNRLKGIHIPETIKKSIKKNIKLLDEQIAELETEIESLTESNDEIKNKKEILESAVGIGPVASNTIISELPELGSASKREIAALVGVAPMNRDSGTSLNGVRYTRGGRANVRTALFTAAIAATRFNPDIREFYLKLLAKGKKKKVAIVACMRKLIVILNAMMRDNKKWGEMAEAA